MLEASAEQLTLTAGDAVHEVDARRAEEIRSFLPCGNSSHSEVVLQHGFQLREECAPAVDAPLDVMLLATDGGAVLATEAGGQLSVVCAPKRRRVGLPGGWVAEFNEAEEAHTATNPRVLVHTAVVSAADVRAVVQQTPYSVWTARFSRGNETHALPALLVRQPLDAFVEARCWFPCTAPSDSAQLLDRVRRHLGVA